MTSVDDKILGKIVKKKAGHIFLLDDFENLGSAGAIRVAMHRLVKKGIMQRIIPGLFVKPQTSKLLNKEVLPDLDSIAQAIARRDNAKIIPTGVYALNTLGLSTQVPLNIVYLTDGKDRKIKVGKANIRFKKTSPKKLALKGKISKLVILAMSEIGKGKLTKIEIDKLTLLLEKENIEDLKHDLTLAPQWIAEIIKMNLKNEC